MVQTRLSIYGESELMDPRLAVEIGPRHLVLVAGSGNRLAGLEYFDIDGAGLEQALETAKNSGELLKRQYSETKLYYNLAESVLVPVGQFNSSLAADFVDLAFGPAKETRVNVESINVSPGIVNVYRTQESWNDITGRYFRATTRRHLHSRLVEQAAENGNRMHARVYDDSFTLTITSEGQVQLVRSFDYAGAEDLLYWLMNSCKQLDLAATTRLVIGGFVDEDGETYRLITKYFPDTVMEDTGNIELPADPGKPAHYFSPFIKLLS